MTNILEIMNKTPVLKAQPYKTSESPGQVLTDTEIKNKGIPPRLLLFYIAPAAVSAAGTG